MMIYREVQHLQSAVIHMPRPSVRSGLCAFDTDDLEPLGPEKVAKIAEKNASFAGERISKFCKNKEFHPANRLEKECGNILSDVKVGLIPSRV